VRAGPAATGRLATGRYDRGGRRAWGLFVTAVASEQPDLRLAPTYHRLFRSYNDRQRQRLFLIE
jgi:hypothetical protein